MMLFLLFYNQLLKFTTWRQLAYRILLVSGFLCGLPTVSWGCATCLCGDPTLTLMGTEKPFLGRFRISADFLYRGEETGIAGFNRQEVTENRFTLGLSYALNQKLSLGLKIPVIRKELETASLAEESVTGLSDITVTGKWFIYQDDVAETRHMAGLLTGLRMPTSEEAEDNGRAYDIDVQPGTGAWVPQLGAWYGYYEFPWFFYVSSVVHYATEGYQGFTAGTAVVTTGLVQYAFSPVIAGQLSLDTRWSDKHEFGDEADPDSGGFLGFVSPGVVVTLAEDLLLNAKVQIPVIDNLNGNQDKSATFQIGLTYDF